MLLLVVPGQPTWSVREFYFYLESGLTVNTLFPDQNFQRFLEKIPTWPISTHTHTHTQQTNEQTGWWSWITNDDMACLYNFYLYTGISIERAHRGWLICYFATHACWGKSGVHAVNYY